MSTVADPHWGYFLPSDEEIEDVPAPILRWDWKTITSAEEAAEMAAEATWDNREGYEWMLPEATVIAIVHDNEPPVLFNVSTYLAPSFYGVEEPDRERRKS